MNSHVCQKTFGDNKVAVFMHFIPTIFIYFETAH